MPDADCSHWGKAFEDVTSDEVSSPAGCYPGSSETHLHRESPGASAGPAQVRILRGTRTPLSNKMCPARLNLPVTEPCPVCYDGIRKPSTQIAAPEARRFLLLRPASPSRSNQDKVVKGRSEVYKAVTQQGLQPGEPVPSLTVPSPGTRSASAHRGRL